MTIAPSPLIASGELTPAGLSKVHAAVSREEDRREKLVADLRLLAEAATRAIPAAEAGKLHYSWQGYSLYNLMHDITDCDALYDIRNEIGRELGIDSTGERIRFMGDRS